MSTATTTQQAFNCNPVRGARDFPPPALRKQKYLFDKWRSASTKFSFEEYDAPIVEHSSLWTAKNGGTDDILSEMFTLTPKEGVEYTLRPEMTPSVARMIYSAKKTMAFPVRWFSVPQCWRFETTARGRKREFYQWNIDIFGAVPVNSEIEVFSLIVNFLESVGLTAESVTINYSDRRILEYFICEDLGVPSENFAAVCNIIDKIGKVKSRSDISEMLAEKGVDSSEATVDRIYLFQTVKTISDVPKVLGEKYAELPAFVEMKKIVEICETIGIGEWLNIDLSVVRGLSYYTGLVFEGFFKNSELKRALLGGGRYDNLISSFTNDERDRIPAIGFGMGDVVVMDVLAEMGLLPADSIFEKKSVDYLIIAYNAELYAEGVKIANAIRKNAPVPRICVENYIISESVKTKAALDYANKIGAEFVVLLFPTEWEKGCVKVKSMKEGIQRELTVSELYAEIGFSVAAESTTTNTILTGTFSQRVMTEFNRLGLQRSADDVCGISTSEYYDDANSTPK